MPDVEPIDWSWPMDTLLLFIPAFWPMIWELFELESSLGRLILFGLCLFSEFIIIIYNFEAKNSWIINLFIINDLVDM